MRVLITVSPGGIKNKEMRRVTLRNVRFSGTVGKLCGAGRERYSVRQTETKVAGAFMDERGKDASEAAHMYVQTRAKGRTGETTSEGTDKREGEKHEERERRSRSLKAKWPGCAPCITISLGKS